MYVLGATVGGCAYCGEEIAPGEEYYDIDGALVHDDCICDYVRQYAREMGWKRQTMGEEAV